jgi:cytochrome bd-type quinol oxidase subunit 2
MTIPSLRTGAGRAAPAPFRSSPAWEDGYHSLPGLLLAALPLKQSFALQQDRARGWKGGSLWLRWFPGIVFFVSFFILFLILALPKFTADSSAALLIPLPASQSYLLALLAITIYTVLTSLVLYFVWEWGIFRGLLLFHRTMVWGPDKVRIQDIHSLFAEKEEIL